MLNETQKKINSLLYLAYKAYKDFNYYQNKFEESSSMRKAEMYEAIADEKFKKAKIYLECWSIMTDTKISVVSLRHFKDDDFTNETTSIIED